MHSVNTHHHHHHPAAVRSSSTAGATLPAARPQRPVVNITLLTCQASRCHYATLGVQPTASADDIKSAFRKLALQLHPDINTTPNATEHFKTVKVAYEVLSDPQQRAAYNRQRLQAQTSYTRSSHSTSTPSGGVEYVVYDYVEDIDETFEEAAAAGFWGWYQKSGSWQSSWDNRQKRKRRRQQQQTEQQQTQQQTQQQSSRQQQTRRQAAQQAQHRQARQRQQARQQQQATLQQMVSQLDPATLKMVRSLFGEDLERLDSLEDLVEVLDSLELLRMQGIDLDAIMFDDGSSGGGTGGSSNSRRGSSASQASSSRAGRSSSSTSSSRAGRSSSTSSSSRRGSAARAGRRQPGRHLPRFDELSAEELYELINSQTDRKTAKAALAWVQEQLATNRMHPGVAGSLAFLLATDYVMPDLEQPDPREFVFGEMFDPNSERYRGCVRAGSPGDYVKYSSDGSSSSEDVDGEEVEGGWVDVDELLSFFEAWEQSDAWDD